MCKGMIFSFENMNIKGLVTCDLNINPLVFEKMEVQGINVLDRIFFLVMFVIIHFYSASIV